MVSLDHVGGLRRSFRAIKRRDEEQHGDYRTKRVILEVYDALAEAIRTGRPYQTPLDPPPGPPVTGLPDWQPGQPRPANWPSHIHPPRRRRPIPAPAAAVQTGRPRRLADDPRPVPGLLQDPRPHRPYGKQPRLLARSGSRHPIRQARAPRCARRVQTTQSQQVNRPEAHHPSPRETTIVEVNPEKQNINTLFSTTNYHIDFYQREYKWKDDEVKRLIEDIFYHFEQSYAKHADLDPTEANVGAKYSWYYLNTYITNKTDGRIFVVDGQQRLTTLTLMLIALYHLCAPNCLDSPELRDWLKAKIAGVGVGGKRQFWMAHSKREPLMQALFSGTTPTEDMIDDGITARHIIENYGLIQTELATRLPTRHKLDTFIFYFLCMVVIINLEVERTDVPMIFEVINDRGVRLQPYEILKGKLLGQIDKAEVDQFADTWDASLHELEARAEDEVDTFFRTYLRAHFSETRKQGQTFDGPYHRAIFDAACDDVLHLKRNAQGVKAFLKGPFRHYARLFLKLCRLGEDEQSAIPECYYSSRLNRMDGHIMLAVAACGVDDPDEDAKIRAVARAFDRAYVMLQLNRAYDSNQFQELLYKLHPLLRGCPTDDIERRIDAQVLAEINLRRNTNAETLLSYGQFKQVGYGDYNTRFLRYFLARIEAFIANGLGKNLQDSLYNYVCGTGRGNAYHVEHILARNNESRGLFKNSDGEPDDALFENERNRFGGLLLLWGQDNQSSGKEPYKDKLRTYTGNAPYLAQTLVPDFYKSNSAMDTFIQQSGLPFASVPQFTRKALEDRSELLYAMTRKIWRV